MTTTTSATRAKCSRCMFGITDLVPDPNAPFISGQSKRRISGFRCHISRPGNNGFPVVKGEDFCCYFAERETGRRPLAHYLTAGTSADGQEGGANA